MPELTKERHRAEGAGNPRWARCVCVWKCVPSHTGLCGVSLLLSVDIGMFSS